MTDQVGPGKEEELIEEIDYILLTGSRDEQNQEWFISKLITRIGQAYAKGELKLPGEVDRIEWHPWFPEPKEPWMAVAIRVYAATGFIALKSEEEPCPKTP